VKTVAGKIFSERHQGRVYVVTGGGSGIGAATCVRLAAEGAKVVVADIRPGLAEAIARQIEAAGGTAIAVACNVASEPDVQALFARTLEAFGALRGVFANAGTATRGWLHEMDLASWNRIIDVNLTGPFLCAKHALPIMVAAGAGVFVTTGSVASIVVGPGGSAASYAASKGGLLQLTRQIAVDYAPQGVRAVCVLPGLVQTELGKHITEDAGTDLSSPDLRLPRPTPWWPIPHMGEPDEVAAAVSFILSDEASFITAIGLPVDGGLTAV
jgi:NAD(P)-dependent dehydrogenase (short-subunit alcohol dehydrogenase family)